MSSRHGHVLPCDDLRTRKHRAQDVAQSLGAPKSLEDTSWDKVLSLWV